MLESCKPQALIPLQRDLQQLSVGFAELKDTIFANQMRQLKYDTRIKQLLERLPPSNIEISHSLEKKLGAVWKELPVEVRECLIEAEIYYSSKLSKAFAIICFHEAVEASLNHCIKRPLIKSLRKRDNKQIALCISQEQKLQYMSIGQLEKIQVRQWGKALEMLYTAKGSVVLGTQDLREFLKEHLGEQRLPDLSRLAHSLQRVQDYRGGSAHFQEPTSRSYNEEKQNLEQIRNLVLGKEQDSVIAQIFQLLAPQELR
ncbi:hypothetical protein ES707_07268 [subsurface metagenome]